GVATGGNVNAGSVDLTINNPDAGVIGGEAFLTFNTAGTLSTTSDVNLILNNAGGTIGSQASIAMGTVAASVGGGLNMVIANNDGGTISGDANLLLNSTGPLTVGGDAGFFIDNSSLNSADFVPGLEIASNATMTLFAPSFSTGGGLFTFLLNAGGG